MSLGDIAPSGFMNLIRSSEYLFSISIPELKRTMVVPQVFQATRASRTFWLSMNVAWSKAVSILWRIASLVNS